MERRARLLVLGAVVGMLTACTAAPPVVPTSAPSPTSSSSGTGAPASDELFTPVIANVLAAPHATPTTDGRIHLAYELLLSNILSQSVTLDGVAVLGDGDELLDLSGDELQQWVKVYGETEPTQTMGPGQRALVWVDVVVDSLSAVPQSLEHVVTISPEQALEPIFGSPMIEMVAPTTPVKTEPITISPPLYGANWLDGNSCCEVTPHRAAVNSINGALWAPERFAIDYVQLDDDGRVFDGPADDLSSYAYYGADVHAVGEGPIVAMVWDYPEQVPGANPSGLPVEEYGGNHIVQDLGGGHYAFYAHLQGENPEGLSIGQQLSAGQVLAQLGNTGNTSAPHLHFHIMDSPLPLASNGLPFLIDDFTLQGRVAGDDALDACSGDQPNPCELDAGDSGTRKDVSPLYLDVMTYTPR